MNGRLCLYFVVGLTFLGSNSASCNPAYDTPQPLAADQILPAEVLEGPHHRVVSPVATDGFLFFFEIESDFGNFSAEGKWMLEKRIAEVNALAEIERISKSRVFLNSVADAAVDTLVSPVRLAQEIAKRPMSTITGIPKGVGNVLRRNLNEARQVAGDVRQGVSDTLSSPGEKTTVDRMAGGGRKVVRQYFSLNRSERNWHQKLGTDPYTRNEVLRRAIQNVAWAESLGRFGVRFASLPTIAGIGYVDKLHEAIWELDPYTLRQQNQHRLQSLGLSAEEAQLFLDHPHYIASMQTQLLASMEFLAAVDGHAAVMKAALQAESESEAWFILHSVSMLQWIDQHHLSLARLAATAGVPFARTTEGRVIVPIPIDHLLWTPLAEALAEELETATSPGSSSIEVWITGPVSAKASAAIDRMGVTIVQAADLMQE